MKTVIIALVVCLLAVIIIYVAAFRNSNDERNNVTEPDESEKLLLKRFREIYPSDEKLEIGNKIVHLVKEGMTENQVKEMLGNSPSIHSVKKNLWYYRLLWASTIRITFGKDGKVKEVFLERNIGEGEESEEVLLKLFRETKVHQDKRMLGRKIIHLIKEGMPKSKIREMLGKPERISEEKNYCYYMLWSGFSFIRISFDDADNVKEVYAKIDQL